MTLKFAREFCKAEGLSLSLPSIGTIRYATKDKSPYFFSRRSIKFHDRGHGRHALKVIRGADGSIQVTNGPSFWRFTGDDLSYIL